MIPSSVYKPSVFIQSSNSELGKGIDSSQKIVQTWFSYTMRVVFDFLDCSVPLVVLLYVIIV